MRSNKLEYNTAACMYCTTRDVKVPFCMPEFSSSNIINHRFHVDNDKVELSIGYDMIIGHDLIVQLDLTANFKFQLLQWDGATVYMKDARSCLESCNLTKHEICEVVIQTVESASTQEATERMVKTLHSTYAMEDLKKVADNKTQMNSE